MYQFPKTGFIRLLHIIGDNKAQPPVPTVVSFCKSTGWESIKSGRYPSSVKLGPHTTAWRIGDIRELIGAAR